MIRAYAILNDDSQYWGRRSDGTFDWQDEYERALVFGTEMQAKIASGRVRQVKVKGKPIFMPPIGGRVVEYLLANKEDRKRRDSEEV